MFVLKKAIMAPALNGPLKGAPAVLNNKTSHNQSRSLCRKSKLEASKAYRWPYEKFTWNYLTMWFDPFTKKKFNENTKLVIVEGNVDAGKEVVAKKLADELGLLYLPPDLDLDNHYINPYGFDYRALNSLLPERLRICDFDMWHKNPSRLSVIHMQQNIFRRRTFQYYRALRHMFNTGQGVVLTRCGLSDRVFVEAMHNMGWLPKGYLASDGVRYYDWRLRYNTMRNMLYTKLEKPHLVVYVDTPVDVCLERIKNDPNPNVRNSSALTREFLEEIENAYRDVILPKYDINGHVYRVDASEKLEEEDFVQMLDDIEALDFVQDSYDTRFHTWDDRGYAFYREKRRLYTSYVMVDQLAPMAYLPYYDIAGMGDVISNADLVLRDAVYTNYVGEFGYKKKYIYDRSIHGFLGTYVSWDNYEKRLERQMRLDYC